jgi:mannose-6-phosphate isomerase-like protein (cupin superfamily)
MKHVFQKPWGWEFEVTSSQSFALWYLEILPDKSTSLHCHLKKTTGYIVLSGQVEVEFLSSKVILNAGDSINLRRSVFHRTRALGNKANVLEIESPNEKDDLLRLEDESGRVDSSYSRLSQVKDPEIISLMNNVQESFSSKNGKYIFSDLEVTIKHTSIDSVLSMDQYCHTVALLEGSTPVVSGGKCIAEDGIFSAGNISKVEVLRRMRSVNDFSNHVTLLLVSPHDQ